MQQLPKQLHGNIFNIILLFLHVSFFLSTKKSIKANKACKIAKNAFQEHSFTHAFISRTTTNTSAVTLPSEMIPTDLAMALAVIG
jgi:hypothetical protein